MNFTNLIGNTPIVKLPFLSNVKHTVFAKLEYYNFTGSIKDRAVLAIIWQLQEKYKSLKGKTIIEATSGNTGISLAALATLFGYKAIIFLPENMSKERQSLIKLYGANLILTAKQNGIKGAINACNDYLKKHPQAILLDQFNNSAPVLMHYLTTAPEIYQQLNYVDNIIVGIGTGATITGIGQYFKQIKPTVKIIAVEPAGSPVISQNITGPHQIEGIGAGFIPSILDLTIIDKIVTISDKQAKAMLALAAKNGLFIGLSSAAALAASNQIKNGTTLVICPDNGMKYLSCL